MPGGPPAAILVHGAWQGAWCWERATAALAGAGIKALAIDLPGHGNDPGPLSDLHGDAAHVSRRSTRSTALSSWSATPMAAR